MRDARLQYFLTFATLGAVLPYISVFFRYAGLSQQQIGYAFAIWSLASVFSPAAVTMLADRAGDPRRLLGIASALTALALVAVVLAHGVGAILGAWAIYCLVSMPIFPLQDGIHFSLQQRRRERGEVVIPYHLVRAWGTVGYIVPTVGLLWFLHAGMSLSGALLTGGGLAAVAAIQTAWLLDPRQDAADATHQAAKNPGRLPTFGAAKVLFGPHLIAFTIAVMLMNMTAHIHSGFYPVYLIERIHLSDTWLGPASNVAVVVEAGVIFACGWLIHHVGLKRLLVLAMLVTALRMGLLGMVPNVWIAIGSQVFHGLLILAVGVLPQAIFNECAEERYRHSMQGMLVMVTSAGRTVATLIAGKVAGWSLPGVFNGAALLCLAAAVLVIFGFHERRVQPAGAIEEEDPADAEPLAAAATDRV